MAKQQIAPSSDKWALGAHRPKQANNFKKCRMWESKVYQYAFIDLGEAS